MAAREDDGPADPPWELRPRLRGRLHLLAAVISLAGLAWLVRSAETAAGQVAAWVYGLSCVLLYGTSSSYHVFTRSPRARRVMQRADHSMIYVLIAGTFTPMCLLAMSDPWRWILLGGIWAAAIAGMVLTMAALERFRRWTFALYLVMGWAGVAAVPALLDEPIRLVLVFVAGVLYTVGAVLFSLHRPRLHPGWFGYHELWHLLGVLAGALFFAVNLALVQAS
jgi:hemolysin III